MVIFPRHAPLRVALKGFINCMKKIAATSSLANLQQCWQIQVEQNLDKTFLTKAQNKHPQALSINHNAYPLSDLVHLLIKKIAVLVKVLISQDSFTHHFVGYLPFVIHHEFQHFIVGFPRKHYPSCVKLKQCRSHRPQIYAVVIFCSYNCTNIIISIWNLPVLKFALQSIEAI